MGSLVARSQAEEPTSARSPVAAALSSVFSPAKAPEQKTMGLLQRSFLDIAEQSGSTLQLAIVVDGTDSMTAELAGVRDAANQMIDDLRRYRGDQVEVALVIYRDSGSPSGEVTVPLKSFSRDTERITSAIRQIVAESGAPFFHELTDVGIHTALSELPWSSDPQVARWIMLFGDSPPYEPSFADPRFPAARRRYATELLVALAARKSIRIHTVLCPSDGVVSQPYDQAIDQTRQFMNSLASGTDGLMLDLSYPDIQSALIEAGSKPDWQYVAIKPITRADLFIPNPEVGSSAAEPETNRDDVKIAVMPHMPLERMSFDPDEPAVQVSTALRHNFASVPGVRVVSPIDIQRQLRRLRGDSIPEDQQLRALAARLGVDYVVWGSREPSGPTVQSAAYRRSDGGRVVQVSLRGDDSSLTEVLLTAAATAPEERDRPLGGLLERVRQAGLMAVVQTPLASDRATQKELLAAIESLEQAVGLPAGSEDSIRLLDRAEAAVTAAETVEPTNPLVHWLGSNIAYNRASYLYGSGQSEAAEKQMQRMAQSLKRAYRDRRRVRSAALATEIEADHALLIRRDAGQAIEGYLKLTETGQPSESQRRGHWMLSGIYAGDWGVAESAVEPVLAREQIVAILTRWPESGEAELLRKWMRWDDSVGMTKYSYLPIVNRQLAKAVPAEP